MGQKVVTMEQKLAAVLIEAQAGKAVSVTEACERLGISRQTFYKYRRRFAEQGLAGLTEQSRRPHTSPTSTDAAMVAMIVATRGYLAEEGWDNGAQSIYYRLLFDGQQPPAWRTIHRVLRREGLILDEPRKRPRAALKRFQFPATNDCWQIDAFQHRLAGGSVVVVFEIKDDHSRYQIANLAWPLEDAQGAWAVVAAGIDIYGPPRMLLSDNGLAFSGKRIGTEVLMERNLIKLGARPVTSRPYHPQTCGKNERGHRTLQNWLSRRRRPATLAELQTLLDEYLVRYNNRPHQALDGDTPALRRIAGIRHPADPLQPLPPRTTAVTATVDSRGYIYSDNMRIWLGIPYAGMSVVAFTRGDHMLVFRNEHLIRELTLDRTRTIQPNPNGRKTHTRKITTTTPQQLSAMS